MHICSRLSPAPVRRCLLGALALWASACGACANSTTARRHLTPLTPVAGLDLQRYVGTWYEIARFPERFEAGCFAATATYTRRPDGTIAVANACRKGAFDGPEEVATGQARVPDPTQPAKLEVSFLRPFWADYWVIEVDPSYAHAVVGHPSRDHLWVLSRTPQLDAGRYEGILQRLRDVGYEVERLQKTPQPPA